MQKFITFLVLALTPLGAYSKLQVCATTSLVADLVNQVGGEHVEVHALMGPGVDPHLYKAKASDIKTLMRASVIFYNGLHLEGRMDDLLRHLKAQGRATYPVTEKIDKKELITLKGTEYSDPHIWFNPRLWGQCALLIGKALAQEDPEHATEYIQQAHNVQLSLQNLYQWAQHYTQTLPKDTRILITSHDAYNYFGQAFDFQVIGVQGVSTVSEAGLADIMSTIDFIKEKKIKAIFVETSVSPASITRISQDSGAKIGGQLFSDALGPKNPILTLHGSFDCNSYEGMFKYNVTTIIETLK